MVERLLTALRVLAATAPQQRRIGRDLAHPGEIAPEYADAWLTARQCPGLEFTPQQTELLDELDGMLESMAHLEPTRPDAVAPLAEPDEWTSVRALACRALICLGYGGATG